MVEVPVQLVAPTISLLLQTWWYVCLWLL